MKAGLSFFPKGHYACPENAVFGSLLMLTDIYDSEK